MNDIHWLSQDEYDKAKGQLQLQVGEILSIFNMYGMGEYIKGAIGEIVEVAEDFSVRCRGDKDQPIRVKNRRNPRI